MNELDTVWLRVSLHGPDFPGGVTWETIAPFAGSFAVARQDARKGLRAAPNATHAVLERPDGRRWRTVERIDRTNQKERP